MPTTAVQQKEVAIGILTRRELFRRALCLQECPVFVQPMNRVIDLRRYLSLSVGRLPTSEVVHYTQLLAELLAQGRLRPATGIGGRTVTYHDSCYLGRYNGIYQEPREILRAIPGLRLVEMERSKASSFCCGGGGGGMWLEVPVEVRMSMKRLEQAMAVEAGLIGTACPYCLLMLDDAVKVKGMEEQIKAMDLLELLTLALGKEEGTEV